jgi:nitroreductase/NAD-dependent dihydropyrimidine dehydrogenase PreA subunit
MGVPYSLGSETGQPRVDRSACNECGDCAEACPAGVLESRAEGIVVHPEVGFGCIACAHCMMVCPNDAISVSGRRLDPGQLVPLPRPEARAGATALRALMLARRSVRRFAPDPVEREVLERVLAAAATAPMGVPPWDVGVVVLHGRERVRELSAAVVRGYRQLLRFADNAPARGLLRLLSRRTSFEQMAGFILPLGREIVRRWDEGRDHVLYDAPATLVFHSSAYADQADAVIPCTYAMLAAEAEGLGSTMIGCVAPVIARDKRLLAKLGLPPGHLPRIVLILGKPAVRFVKAIERPLASITWH